ncbi:reduced viability upon starvation protein 167 [Trichomonascus vanleenenianus]|uniref:BAR and SH3 domains-containing protein n=1 Tax=Trichomonascus vanleenenianus TaxID=2268995 RepID=UPI003EC9CAD9
MIKGAKKAIVRAPHRIYGNKSAEERVIIEWTKDFNTAEAAVDQLVSDTKEFIKNWKELFGSQQKLVQLLAELYNRSEDSNVYTAVQAIPESATQAVDKFADTVDRIESLTIPVIENLEDSFLSKCKEAKECINAVQKALKKREHKKIDFDRHSNTVEKYLRKDSLSDKEQQSLAKAEAEVDDSMEIFQAQDAKVKTYIPFFLNCFSEFLNPLTSILYLAQLRVFEILKRELYLYSQSQGLLATTHSEGGAEGIQTYDEIGDEWETRFLKIQPSCEEALKTLREGSTVQKPMALPSKSRASRMLEKTWDKSAGFTTKTVKKMTHHGVSNIEFSSPEMGFFRSEADILNATPSPIPLHSPLPRSGSQSPVHSDSGSLMPRLPFASMFTRQRSPSLGTTSSIPRQNRDASHSPVVFTTSDQASSEATVTRVRAFSSASARALSPASSPSGSSLTYPFTSAKIPDSKLTSYAVRARSESDEYATALYTFSGEVPGDVAFRAGDKIRVLDYGDENDAQWWFGETIDGRLGLFPCNYVAVEPHTPQ